MESKKKILVISTFYLRSNHIGSIRPQKIVKYLSATGKYDISVITPVNEYEINDETQKYPVDLSVVKNEECIFISYFSISNTIKKILRKLRSAKRQKADASSTLPEGIVSQDKYDMYPGNRLTLHAEYLVNILDGFSFYRRAKKAYRKGKLPSADIIFATYPEFSCQYIARYLKKKNPAVFWIADFRDPVLRETTPELFTIYNKNFTKKKCNTADAITMVSQGMRESTVIPEDVPVHIITNGFDPDDVPAAGNQKSDRFIITYTGTFYSAWQDFTALFHAIRDLIGEGRISRDKIRFEYAGKKDKDFIEHIKSSGIEDILHSYGFVTRKKALEIQKNSSILIVASYCTPGATGILSGKFLEYMMMGKPVVSIIIGDLPGSEIKEITNKCSLGFCYEKACGEKDYEMLKEYIFDQYNRFFEHGAVLFEPNYGEILKYSYPNIAKELEKLFI